MSKLSRHKAILALLEEGPVLSQDELQRLLRKRGLDAGQATLSRDIRELGLAKTASGYSLPGKACHPEHRGFSTPYQSWFGFGLRLRPGPSHCSAVSLSCGPVDL